MNVEDIPADTTLTLTSELDRLFKAAGCIPGCHACEGDIYLEEKFMLLSFNGTDQMLCQDCDRGDLERALELKEQRREELMRQFPPRRGANYGGSGYSRPSRRNKP